MATIRRIADSCLTVTGDRGTTVIDPGFFAMESPEIDLDSIGDVQRVLITHEHYDHVHPGFVQWLLDRGQDVSVHANEAVASLLAKHDIEVDGDNPQGVTSEDVLHEVIASGHAPPNRAFTVDGLLTHPGDSYQPSSTAPVLALPLIVPWGSTTRSVVFARELAPQQVVPIHDFYLTKPGRDFVVGMASGVLAKSGIEVVPLDWGDSFSV